MDQHWRIDHDRWTIDYCRRNIHPGRRCHDDRAPDPVATVPISAVAGAGAAVAVPGAATTVAARVAAARMWAICTLAASRAAWRISSAGRGRRSTAGRAGWCAAVVAVRPRTCRSRISERGEGGDSAEADGQEPSDDGRFFYHDCDPEHWGNAKNGNCCMRAPAWLFGDRLMAGPQVNAGALTLNLPLCGMRSPAGQRGPNPLGVRFDSYAMTDESRP